MTLVLLHSAGRTPSLWDRVRERLVGIPAVAPPLPGRDDAGWPAGERGRDVGAFARSVVGYLDSIEVERAVVCGHSLGGAVALAMALDHPGRVAGIGLVASGARLRVWPQVLDGLQDGLRDVVDFIVNASLGPGGADRDRIVLRRMIEAVGAEQTLADFRACDAFDVMDRLAEIRVPALVLAGDQDVATPPKYARYLAERIAAARLVLYEGAGHELPLERPDEVAGELAVLWASAAPVGRVAPSAGRAAETIRPGWG